MSVPPLLQVDQVRVSFPVKTSVFGKPQAWVRAVDGVSLDMRSGETVGLVGESGCGKSTLGRTILALQRPDEGRVLLRGHDLYSLHPGELKQQRRHMQLVFQDPRSSLDPRRTVGASVRMALDVQDVLPPAERRDAVAEIFRQVGLRPEHIDRYPHEFSGGQLQRIGIARALILKPELLVCDEPVSALDVSVQAQILNLLKELQSEFHLGILFISHNLAVVEHMVDRVAVMYYGRIVELASRGAIFAAPLHPYTQALLSAVPSLDPDRADETLRPLGEPPNPARLPSGCRFRSRCPLAFDRCSESEPVLAPTSPHHAVACWAVTVQGPTPEHAARQPTNSEQQKV